MPRSKKNGGKGGPDATVVMPFRVSTAAGWPTTVSTSITNYDLNIGNLGARIAAIGPCYEYFRISNFRVYAYADQAGLTYDTVGATKVGIVNGMGFLAFDPEPDVGTGTPTSYTQCVQFGHFSAGNIRHKLGFRVNRSDLYGATPFKWFRTVNTGSFTSDELSCGCLYIGVTNQISTASAPTLQVIIEGRVEFKGAVTPSLSFDKDGSVKALLPSASRAEDEDDSKSEVVIVRTIKGKAR